MRWIKLISSLVEIADIVTERDVNTDACTDPIWVVELILLTEANLVARLLV